MGYKVITPLVIVGPSEKSGDDGANDGPRYFYEHGVIPAGFNDERCKELVEEGMLEEVSDAEAGGDDGPPAKSASKGDWEAYARSQGAEDDDLDGKTKDDLIAAYGD